MRSVRIRIAVGRAQYRAFTSIGQRLLRLSRSTVNVDGVIIPVISRPGRGDPLLFVHGFGADKEGWIGLMSRFRGRAMIALDLPGFGAASRIERERATADRQADALRGVLDALGVKRATLVGASMGGAISLRFASLFPERTRALALLGSVGPAVDPSPLVKALAEGNNPLIPSSHDEFHDMLDFVTAKRPWVPTSIAAYLAAEQVARKAELTELFDGWLAQDAKVLDAALSHVVAPALVIHGALDRVIDVSTARAIAAHVPHATLRVMPGIGHVPQLEAPAEVARMIEKFLDDRQRADALVNQVA